MRALSAFAFLISSTLLCQSSAVAEQPLTPAALRPCPFTEAEIETALGVAVEPAQVADMKVPGGRDVGCLYAIEGSVSMAVAVRQTWDPSGAGVASSQAGAAAGEPEGETSPIPGDPDGAQWTAGGGNGPRLELSYRRGKVRARVMAFGGTFAEADMKPKLLRLRRVP